MYKVNSMKGVNEALKRENRELRKDIEQLKKNLKEMETCAKSWMDDCTAFRNRYEPEVIIPIDVLDGSYIHWCPSAKTVKELEDKFIIPYVNRKTGEMEYYEGPKLNDVRYVEETLSAFILTDAGWRVIEDRVVLGAGNKDD
jgi:hypothetical protein